MKSTVFSCVVVGFASLLLTLEGTACLLAVKNVCVVTQSSSIVMLTIGVSMLVPITCCLFAARADSCEARDNNKFRLSEGQKQYEAQSCKPFRRLKMYLFASHFLSAWGDRMWEFAVPVLFMEIFVDTLLPSATLSLVMYASCLILIPSVGRQLDSTDRWKAMRLAIILDNINIIVSSMLMGAMALLTDANEYHKPEWTWSLKVLFVGILVCGGMGQVLSEAQTLGIERDWVVVIAKSSEVEHTFALESLNTRLRRIDLVCKLLGPLAFGIIMEFAGYDRTTRALIGTISVAIWNGLASPLQYLMTRDIYNFVPELAIKKKSPDSKKQCHPLDTSSTLFKYAMMWRVYAQHPVFLLSFSYCTLYMTVLDNGALSTAYLKWRGLPDSLLGFSRGAGAMFGLLGTVLFPFLRQAFSRLERVAVASIWLFWLSLLPVLVAFLLTGESRMSDYVMLCSVAAARVWLWSADLAEVQLLQEWIEPSRRGAINAMQTATYQLFHVVIQMAGFVFHDPSQFSMLIYFSVAAVLAAALGFTLWYVRYGYHRSLLLRCTTESPNYAKSLW